MLPRAKPLSPVCKEIGVTRISDITLLDRLYIPNYSTTLPGTDDIFWVYGGKGTTKTQAKVSALMESVEEYSSMQRTNPKTDAKTTFVLELILKHRHINVDKVG